MDYTVYSYIADNNAQGAIDVLDSYGFEPENDTVASIAYALSYLVEQYGDKAIKDIMSVHPDRDIIVEYFGNSAHSAFDADNTNTPAPIVVPPANVAPPQPVINITTPATPVNSDTHHYDRDNKYQIRDSVMLIGAALIVAAIIVSSKK